MKIFGALVLGMLAVTVGCASEAADDGGPGDEQDVVGVTDLGTMESELKLVKDHQTNGVWSRHDAALKGGPCYKRTVGSADGASWEFRRYTKGAAFFHKLSNAPASGDERPVACVDVDGGRGTVAIAGVVLDAAIRFRLGSGWEEDGASGHAYMAFDNGALEVSDAGRWCDIRFPSNHGPADSFDSNDPAIVGGFTASGKCEKSGEPMAACFSAGLAGCKATAAADIAKNTILRPNANGSYMLGLNLGSTHQVIDPSIVSIAYRYANRSAKTTDVFDEATDPVGRFLSMETKGGTTHARFGRLDIHLVETGNENDGGATLSITPKSSDPDIAGRAVVTCKASWKKNVVRTDYACTGL